MEEKSPTDYNVIYLLDTKYMWSLVLEFMKL